MKKIIINSKNITYIDYSVQVIIFITVFFVAGFFSTMSVDTHHDGIMFKPAMDVASGKMLFKETFTQYGALTTLIQAWALQIFGKYLVVIKLTTALFYAFQAVLLWKIWQIIMPSIYAGISIILWLLLCPFFLAIAFPWSTIYALSFELLSLFFLINFLKKNNLKYLFLAGFFCSLVFWCRQPVGIIYFLTIIVFLIFLIPIQNLSPKKLALNIGCYLIGWSIPSILFLFWIIKNNAFHDFWLQSIKFSLVFGETFGAKTILEFVTIFVPWPKNSWNGGYIWDVLPLANTIIIGIVFWRICIKKSKDQSILILLLISLVSLSNWHLYYPFPDFMKAAWGSGLMVGLLTYLIWFIIPIKNSAIHVISVILIIIAIYFNDFSVRFPSILNYYKTNNIVVQKPNVLAGMRLNSDQYDYLTNFSNILDAYFIDHPSKRLINATTDALYLTFTENGDNYHPVYVKWGMLQSIVYFPEYQKSLMTYINKEKPLIVVYLPPNIVTKLIENGVPTIFNGEEMFIGYYVLHEFKGGINLIAPIE